MWLKCSAMNPKMDGFNIGRASISNVPFSLCVFRRNTIAGKEYGMNIMQKIAEIASNFAPLKRIPRDIHGEAKLISVSLFPLA